MTVFRKVLQGCNGCYTLTYKTSIYQVQKATQIPYPCMKPPIRHKLFISHVGARGYHKWSPMWREAAAPLRASRHLAGRTRTRAADGRNTEAPFSSLGHASNEATTGAGAGAAAYQENAA